MQTQKYPAHFLVKCRAFFIRADAVWDFMEFLLKSVDYAAQKVLFYGHRESVKKAKCTNVKEKQERKHRVCTP